MSAGRSSQLVACFSVERTKYLMLSKAISDRSAPHIGIGLRSKTCSALSRFLSIHSGSFLRREMFSTTSGESPRRAVMPAGSGAPPPRRHAGGVGVRPAELVLAKARELGAVDQNVGHVYLSSVRGNRSARLGIPFHSFRSAATAPCWTESPGDLVPRLNTASGGLPISTLTCHLGMGGVREPHQCYRARFLRERQSVAVDTRAHTRPSPTLRERIMPAVLSPWTRVL